MVTLLIFVDRKQDRVMIKFVKPIPTDDSATSHSRLLVDLHVWCNLKPGYVCMRRTTVKDLHVGTSGVCAFTVQLKEGLSQTRVTIRHKNFRSFRPRCMVSAL
jgi:hypothetical protein